MAVVKLNDIIEPSVFTDYIINNVMHNSALMASGVLVPNSVIAAQLDAGAHSFTVPFWNDLADDEANIVTDDPDTLATPHKITAGKQVVRKSFLHNSWANMQLASEIAGSDAQKRIQERVKAYWERQIQKRLVSSLIGVMASNIATDAGDMVHDISAETGDKNKFSAASVIDTAGTLGDALESVTGIAMHGDVYRAALKADLIEFIKPSDGSLAMPTFRGLAVVQDDTMPLDAGKYTTALFGSAAFGFAAGAPKVADGTAVEVSQSSGNGGGMQTLHSRINLGLHPAGFSWEEKVCLSESPSIAEVAEATNWKRVVSRKAVPLAFLVSKL